MTTLPFLVEMQPQKVSTHTIFGDSERNLFVLTAPALQEASPSQRIINRSAYRPIMRRSGPVKADEWNALSETKQWPIFSRVNPLEWNRLFLVNFSFIWRG